MRYNRCPEPDGSQLAKNGPSENIYDHLQTLEIHHRYWSKKEREANDAVDIARATLTGLMHRELFQSSAYFLAPIAMRRNPQLVERDRRTALGMLGMSILLRQIVRPDRFYYDGLGMTPEEMLKSKPLVTDTMDDPDGMPLDHRIHIIPGDAEDLLGQWERDEADAWYKGTALYVHRVRPAKPSDELLVQLDGRTVVDFVNLETLYPYLENV